MLGRSPVMIEGPDGRLMPKKAANKAWANHNRAQRRLGDVQIADRERGSRTRARDMERDQRQKDLTVKSSRVAQRWGRISARLRGFAEKLRYDLPLMFTLITVAVSLTVTLAGQWMFYSSLPWPDAFVWLPVPMSVLVESGSWTYGIQARHLAELDQPYGGKTRRMWMLALLAAGMNSYHGAVAFPDHPEMGLILGGGSILGPMAWHGYIQLTRIRHQRRSGAQIRAAIGRRLHGPILAWKAHQLWSFTGGRITPERAFLIVYRERYGYLPGQRSAVTQRSTQRPVSADGSAETADAETAQPAPELSAEPTAATVSSSADEPPAVALVGGDGSMDPQALTDDEIERFLQSMEGPSADTDSALKTDQNSRSGGVSGGPSERPASAESSAAGSAEPTAATGAEPALDKPSGERRPNGARARRRALKSASKAGLVRAYVDDQMSGGRALEEITGPEVSKALKIGQSTARNELAKIRNEGSHPSP